MDNLQPTTSGQSTPDANKAGFSLHTRPVTEQTIKDELLTLEEGRRAQAERIANSATKPQIRGYFKALRGELSPNRAIRIMCLHCVGWERDETVRCTAYGCPLWAYRPQASGGDE